MIRPDLRRGVTLVELMVAMAIAGLVAVFVSGWIVHTARMSSSSQARDDRDQELSLVRSSLFQDGTRGRLVSATRSGWIVAIPRPGSVVDTFAWEVRDGFLHRSDRALLLSDTVVDAAIVPHFSGEDPAEDPWTRCDRDLDGAVDPEFLSRLTSLEWTLTTRHASFAKTGIQIDTIRIVVPLQGPG